MEANGSGVTGTLVVEYTTGGPLKITGTISENLSAGNHGFHVHTTGSTGNNCADAGDHFNPEGVSTLSVCYTQ